jgi:Na+-translocating ferredoxin:NAD+ oxidoreductase RNF subunit RnfB
MDSIILYTIITVCSIGLIAAVILYIAAQKFKVYEDPRIDEIEAILPGANCGGCGYPGCRNFAESCVKADDLATFYCPAGGNDLMKKIAAILGKVAAEKEPQVAVVRCFGTFEHRPKTNYYDGALNCTIHAQLYSGDTGCPNGCVGLGECVDACRFDAMYMDKETGLPVIIEENCTACGECVKVCPKDIIELRNKGKKGRRVFVSCINTEKGGIARKNCAVACTGCTKCEKECKFDAIKIENFLAYIDYNKCTLCRKCAPVCPTNAIHEIGFPIRKEKTEKQSESEIVSA